MKSMTGSGSASSSSGGWDVSVETRSLNQRHREVTVRLPAGFAWMEPGIRGAVADSCARGRVEVEVKCSRPGGDLPELQPAAVQEYLRIISIIGSKDRLAFGQIEPAAFLALPGVIDSRRTGDAAVSDEAEELIASVLSDALDRLEASKLSEGEKLKAVLGQKMAKVTDLAARLPALTEGLPAKRLEALREKLRLAGADDAEPRLLAEAVVFADKLSIDEELERLRLHAGEFAERLESEEPVGRRLDFILQELNREATTASAKCGSFEAGTVLVEIRSELEQIREQVQNIE